MGDILAPPHDHQHVWERPEVVVSAYVLNGLEPIRMVIHHEAGDWSVLCGTVDNIADVVSKPLSWLLTHPELGQVARTLPTGTMLTRDGAHQAWVQEAAPPDE